jgi:cholesterol transport system auxiliary component
MQHYFLYIFTGLLLLGCSSTTSSVNEYTLLSQETIDSNTIALSHKTLSVASSKSFSSLTGKNLLYLRENGETGSYLYSRWSDTPAALIQQSLLKLLYDQSLFSSISPSSSLSQNDWLLESDLNAFYHRFLKGTSEGYIDMTYRLIDTKTKRTIATKRFVITSPAQTMDAVGGVEALKNSTHKLNHQCSEWLRTLLAKEIK